MLVAMKFKVANCDLKHPADGVDLKWSQHATTSRMTAEDRMRSQIATASFLVLGNCVSSLVANAAAIAQNNH
jgi:hypothetical protein